MQTKSLTAVIHREGGLFVSHCPELDIASQGDSIESARANLAEAVDLFLECADPLEVRDRLHGDIFVTTLPVTVG